MRIIDIINGPWAITPAMLNEIRSIYAKHLRGEKLDKASLDALATQNNVRKSDSSYDLVNGSAIISVDGVLAKKMNLFMSISGGASTQLIERDIRAALSDPLVEQIVLTIDSPGGTVDGTFELANMIYENRGVKPIIAWVDGSAFSAAYAIASSAGKVYLSSEAAGVGSIGVVAAHEDISKWEERYGVKTTEIYAGRYKRAASQYKPLDEEGRKSIQDEVDAFFSVFVDSVARGRGVSSETVIKKMSTEVQSIFIGQQAIDAGMADGFSTLEAIINKADGVPQAGNAAPSAGVVGESQMEQEDSNMDLKELKEKHPDLYKSVFDEGKASGIEEGKKAGAEAELARVKSVKAVAMPGHEALIETLMFDGKTSGQDAAMQVVQAESDKRKKHLANFKADGQDVAADVVDGAAADAAKKAEAAAKKGAAASEDKSLPVAERAKAAWDASAEIRTEFGGNYASFEAYFKAEDAGNIKVFGKK